MTLALSTLDMSSSPSLPSWLTPALRRLAAARRFGRYPGQRRAARREAMAWAASFLRHKR